MKCDHRSKFSNLSNWREEAWKKSGLQRDSNPWPPRYRCDALPTELWSHTLGARSIYWVHIFPCSEMMWRLYEIIHICTAVVDESEMWSSRLETSEEVASSLDVKINNFVRDISLICFLLTKSWHDVVFIFLSKASAGGFKSAKKQTTQRYMNFRLILTSTPCSRSRSRHCSPLSSNMYFVHWTSFGFNALSLNSYYGINIQSEQLGRLKRIKTDHQSLVDWKIFF